MIRRLAPVAVAIAVLVVGALVVAPRPPTPTPPPASDYMIVIGVPGLRWDDIDAARTPTLWRLAETGAIGAMAARSARSLTCPADGWLTLGAGNRARDAVAERRPGSVPPGEPSPPDLGSCGGALPAVEPQAGGGARVEAQRGIVEHNQKLPHGGRPGALPEAVRCTVAIGPGAGVAAARPTGRVDQYRPAPPPVPADLTKLLSVCVLTIVDAGTIPATGRDAALRAADSTVARIVAARPTRATILVAGVSDTGSRARLHVAIAHGDGIAATWLTSPSTSRRGFVQLSDVAPTVLDGLGAPRSRWLAGQPFQADQPRSSDLATSIGTLVDHDRRAGMTRQVSDWFVLVLVLVQIALFVAAVPVLRRARRGAGPAGPRPLPRALVKGVETAAVAASLLMPAALVTNAVPWWRAEQPGLVFLGCLTALVAVATTAIVRGPLHAGSLRTMVAVAALVAGVVGLDVVTGARLQIDGVMGYSSLEGGRYAGLGSLAFGMFAAGALLAAGGLAQRAPTRWRTSVVAGIGAAAVALVGSPYLGADAGGAIAMTAGACVAAAVAAGGWLTISRLLWATLAGFVVTSGFALLDLGRPESDRGHLGRFLVSLGDGSAGAALQRTGQVNVVTLANSWLTWLVVAGALFVGAVLLRPTGGLKRVFGLYPAVRAGLIGLAAAAAIGGVVDGAGVLVAGAAVATAVPLAVVASLRVLTRADERSFASPAESPAPGRGEWPDGDAAARADGDLPTAPVEGTDAPSGVDKSDGEAETTALVRDGDLDTPTVGRP